jgi:hypothetical protein
LAVKRPAFTLVALLAVVGAAAVIGQSATRPFKVTSTLDGRTVLPHRIHWLGFPTLSSQVEVVFLIDGKVGWIEHRPPYVYGDDDNGQHNGFLVTSWLTAGRHRFTVRVVAPDGRKATDTVVARVLPAPQVSAALAGTWQRKLTDVSGAPKPGSAENPTDTLTPAGKYRLTFERRWIHDEFPCTLTPCRYDSKTGGGGMFNSDWTPGATTFRVQGPVTIQVFHDTDRLGGSWCWPDGPPAAYTWSVTGRTLTLAPVGGHDACGIRGFIWSGQWTRVG